MKYFPLTACLLISLFFSCNEVDPNDEKKLREFVKQWNEAHTQIKSPFLDRYYMDVLYYYGQEQTKDQVMQDKKLLFQQFPDYTQSNSNDQLTISKEAGSYVLTFTKHVSYNGIEADYTSYLTVMSKNRVFKILREDVAKNSKNLDAPIFPNTREINTITMNNRQLFGDFNGDGLSDYASVISPEITSDTNTDDQNNSEVQCNAGCNSVIIFSNKALKPITIKGAYKSQLENLKDLNNDGADEIGFWDIKQTTKSLYVFNAVNGSLLTEPIIINTAVHKNLSLIDVFKKTGPNKITVTSSTQVNGKWILKSEVITLD